MMASMREVRAFCDAVGVGDELVCVENTYAPTLNGQRRKVIQVMKSRVRCEIDGRDPEGGYWTEWPDRAGDVVSVDSEEITFVLTRGAGRHRRPVLVAGDVPATLTIRRVVAS